MYTAFRGETIKINPVAVESSHQDEAIRHLSDPDGSLLGADSVIVVGRVSLTTVNRDGFVVAHLDDLDVGGVSTGKGSLVLGADGREDSVGGGNGGILLLLVLGSRVGTRVEQDEGVLFGGDGGEVTLGNGILQSSDAASVSESCSLNGGFADGSISGSHTGHGNDSGGGSDSSHGSTAVHVQSGGGALRSEIRKRQKSYKERLGIEKATTSNLPLSISDGDPSSV